jgi:hypothetical protein
MIAEKIQNANKALGALAGTVPDETWANIRCIRAELTDAADQVAELETNLPVHDAPADAAPARA